MICITVAPSPVPTLKTPLSAPSSGRRLSTIPQRHLADIAVYAVEREA